MVFEVMESIMITTGCVNVIGNVILLLVNFLFGRRTSTGVFISYISLLSLIQQFHSPPFHRFYVSDFTDAFALQELLTLSFSTVLIGVIVALVLLLLMDNFESIKSYKIVVIAIHFSIILLAISLLRITIISSHSQTVLFLGVVLIALAFLLFYISQGNYEFLKKRKQTDDESELRHMFVSVYIWLKVLAVILYVLGLFITKIAFVKGFYYTFGKLGFAISQLESVFFLIVLFKFDHNFVGSFTRLTRGVSQQESWDSQCNTA